MGILVANDGSRLVDTIADRNSIAKRFNRMQITVRDATGDPRFGGGSVTYMWDAVVEAWLPVWSSLKEELQFASEEKTIVNGSVTADNLIKNNQVWSAKVLNSEGLVLGDAQVTVNGNTISLTNSELDGNKLRYTYAFGSMTAQMQDLWEQKVSAESPVFTGAPKAPTPGVDAPTDQVANVEFVQATVTAVAEAVPAAVADVLSDSPVLEGTPIAPTAELGAESEQIVNCQHLSTTLKDAGFALDPVEGWTPPTPPALERYTLKTAATTSVLNLAEQQVFTVAATSARTLQFTNAPGAGRAMTVVVKVTGKAGQITWPAGISWNAGAAPVLGNSFTVVVLLWDGSSWVGSVGSTA